MPVLFLIATALLGASLIIPFPGWGIFLCVAFWFAAAILNVSYPDDGRG